MPNDREIFMNAPAGATAEVLEAYLDAMCGEDGELRARVEELIAAGDDAGSFLGNPVLKEASTLHNEVAVAGREGETIGNYKLLQKIGEGGFGVVYMADQLKPVKRRVAFKIIKLGMDTKQVVARFEAERQALAMMDHPNIAKVLDAGSTDTGRPFFVMELVKGVPITEFCDERNLSTEERLELFEDVCRAVQHAHQKGIIHRDLKPSNVMVTLHDDKPVVKVIDFGVAKATQMELTEKTLYTRYEQFIGTPAYMSPEQAQLSGLDIDTRSDIYSLGVLLYELLTGRTPFDAKELMSAGYDEIRRIIREDEPPKPSTRLSTLEHAELTDLAKHRRVDPQRLRSLVRGDLDWIVMKALEKDRTRRYETANALGMDVRRHLDDEPVTAAAPSAAYRVSKYVKRHRGPVMSATMILMLLVVGMTTTTLQWMDAREAREREEISRAEAEQQRDRAIENEKNQRLMAYASDMKVADVALRENNLGRVHAILKRHIPASDEEDLRGLEWRYLWHASRGDEVHTFPHESNINGISVSGDGSHLASMTFGGRVRLFDLHSRKMVRFFGDAPGEVKAEAASASIALSPNGEWLAVNRWSGSGRTQAGVLTVWAVDDGSVVLEDRDFEAGATLQFSPDSQRLAALTGRKLLVWDSNSWVERPLPEEVRPVGGGYWALSFTPDSSRLIYGSNKKGGGMSVLNLHTNSVEGTLTGFHPISVATSGSVVAAGGWDGFVCLWDLETRSMIEEPFQAHSGLLFGIALSPDGKTLATGGNDQVIRLWNLETCHADAKNLSTVQSMRGHQDEIWGLCFYEDGKWLASSGKGDTVKLWRTRPAPFRDPIYNIPTDYVCRGFSPSGDFLLFTDRDEWTSPSRGEAVRKDYRLAVDSGNWSGVSRSDSRALQGELAGVWKSGQAGALFGKQDGSVVISDGVATEVVRVASDPVHPLVLGPLGRHFLVNVHPRDGSSSYSVLWRRDGERWEVAARLPEMAEHLDFAQAISPDERFMAYVGPSHTIILWDILAGSRHAILEGHTWVVDGLSFSQDGRLLASCDWDGVGRLWDVESGRAAEPHELRGHRSGPYRAVFSPDGRTVATTSDDMTHKFWSVATAQEMVSLDFVKNVSGVRSYPLLAPSGDRIVRVVGESPNIRIQVTSLPSLEEIDVGMQR